MNDLIIVIPIYKEQPSKYNLISLEQCYKKLDQYQIAFISSASFDPTFFYDHSEKYLNHKPKHIFFPDYYFKSIQGYNRLLLSGGFYKEFLDYNYLLIHQDDCFVFKNNLSDWMKLGYDYIGAPWVKYVDDKIEFEGVGNGGLSLRKVLTFYRIFTSIKYVNRLYELWIYYRPMNWKGKIYHFGDFIYDVSLGSFSHALLNSYKFNEDRYIGKHLFNNGLITTPNCQLASKFSIEKYPREQFNMNAMQRPFGCHAWWKYDFDFMRGLIGNEGYDL